MSLGRWDAFNAEWGCQHDQRELRRRVNRAGSIGYQEQCLRCGDGRAIDGRSLTAQQKAAAPAFDEDLHEVYGKERTKAYNDHVAEQDRQWHDWYANYLTSWEWRAKRQLVFDRANGRCEGCAQQAATQVHHLTYARVGHEMLFDLVAICDQCHEAVHENATR